MKAHELARLLLAGPDLEVYFRERYELVRPRATELRSSDEPGRTRNYVELVEVTDAERQERREREKAAARRARADAEAAQGPDF